MNKIFKVVLNKTTGRLVVVSELVKSVGKSNSLTDKRSSVAGAVLNMMIIGGGGLFGTQALADVKQSIDDTNNNIVYGANLSVDTTTTTNRNLTVFGSASTVVGSDSVVFGSNHNINGGSNNVAIGRSITAQAGGAAKVTLLGQDIEYTGNTVSVTDDPFYRSPGFAVAVGNNLKARYNTVILGHDNETNNTLTTTLGIFAKTNNDRAIAIGYGPKADGLDGMAIGARAEEKGYLSMAIGTRAKALSQQAVAIGPYATAEKAPSATALGMESHATGRSASALGPFAKAHGTRSTAVGVEAKAWAESSTAVGHLAVTEVDAKESLAVGYNTNVSGKQSLAIGVGNLVSANYAGAIGDPSIVKGEGSYTLGNDNAVGSTSTNVGVFGNNNQIGATATYDDTGKLLSASGLTDTEAVENSRAVGNKNYINTSNTYVLGSGVGTKDDGTELSTVANSVYLGNDSTVAVGAAVGTANLDKEGVAGATTTAGDTGTVDTAIVGGVTYGGFAGKTAAGAVSVGSAGLERRVMNVAAGEISATSTDAINGSQLYMVAQGTLDQMPVIYTDTSGNKVIKSPDGNFYPANTPLDATGKPLDTNIQPVTNVIASMNDGDDVANTPKILANVAGNLTPTYNKGDMKIGADGKPTAEAATAPTTSETGPTATEAAKIYNNAATVGDVLNAGWNLQGNGAAKDFVKPYDTVNFADGANTKAVVSTNAEGTESLVQFNVSGLPVSYTTEDGTPVVKVGDKYFKVDAAGNPTKEEVPAADLVTNMINPEAKPNEKGQPSVLGNVAGNLPSTYNTDVYNAGGDAVTKEQTLPVDAQGAALNVNNAATVGDVLNAGWNLQGNGVAQDFVKPYDTVNFVNGNATTATVETAADGKSSTVKYDVQVDDSTIKVVDGKLTVVADSNTVTDVTAGDNITVTSTTDASGNTIYTVATKKDVTFDSVSINGGPTMNADGINMNGDKITNLADGEISPTSKDAVNGSQLHAAVNNINSNIAASKEEVTSNDKSVTVTTTKNTSGSNVFDLSVNTDGTTITKNANGALTVNTTPLTNNTDGSVNTPAESNAIATAGDVANAINNSGFSLSVQGANASLVKPGSAVDMNNTDGNIRISKSASSNNVTYNLSKDIKVDSVSLGDTLVNNDGIVISKGNTDGQTVSVTKNGLDNGGNRITNVAPGINDTDAVNVSQLKQIGGNINNQINQVDADARAGVAQAMATAGLPQAYLPGKSMLAFAGGGYRGEMGYAVGYSTISDGGNWVLKASASGNSRGNAGVTFGAGYQW